MIEEIISHYRVIQKLGAGGMGEVYLAEDLTLSRRVALKMLPAEYTGDSERLRRFKQEARASSALNHPNILTIHEVGEAGGRHYMATEFIEGESLRQHLIQIGKMKASAVLDVGAQVASALAAAHVAGIVHRDVKPENIMMRHDGIVKVLDFGLAKLTEPLYRPGPSGFRETVKDLTQTEPGVIMGTVSYMSPEQAQGLPIDPRTDIWSLGIVIYEMACGHVPFEGATASQVIAAILEKDLPALSTLLPEVTAELQRIVSKALRKDREERFQTVQDMLVDLKFLKQELQFETKQPKRKDVKTFSAASLSFWTTRPGIMIGIATLIMAIAGLYIAWGDADSRSAGPTQSPQPTSTATSVLHPASGPPATSEDCFNQYFSEIPRDRVATMEVGTLQYRLIGLDQPKDRVIGVRFTEYNQTIGAIRFYFFPTNKIFKVETLANSKCQEIEEYSNARGGDKRVLQNGDTLQMRFGNREYSFYLYGASEIFADFTRASP